MKKDWKFINGLFISLAMLVYSNLYYAVFFVISLFFFLPFYALVAFREFTLRKTIALTIIISLIVFGQLGPPTWTWIRVTLLAVSGIALFIVCTVPDHFLEEHLWRHIFIRHVPRIFLWTFGALFVVYMLTEHFQIDLENSIQKGKWVVLFVACLIGMIPESGPHLMFVTLYAQGIIPLSILLASSIVQDGHGMLPMLAHSRRTFLIVKGINFAAGILCGAAAIVLRFR